MKTYCLYIIDLRVTCFSLEIVFTSIYVNFEYLAKINFFENLCKKHYCKELEGKHNLVFHLILKNVVEFHFSQKKYAWTIFILFQI